MAAAEGGPGGDLVLSDPKAIRALAHPARLAVLEALLQGRELTATQCAQIAGLSPSAMSYHLRAMERWGLVERAPASSGRERPWRGKGSGLRVESSAPAATTAAEQALLVTVLDADRRAALDFVARQADESEGWRDAMSLARSNLWLSLEEARDLQGELAAVLERYRGRRDDAGEGPSGTRRVQVSCLVVPTGDGS
ncbi:MAG TPA: winged helix-turn-helix domain-containing protein [Motilibacteraceae bacterium]|nr:winged helix-turn-helix domain-containing protein [Motilibacteraceae bacterium]